MAEGGAPRPTQKDVLNGGRATGVNLNHQDKVNYEKAMSLVINTGGRVLRRVFIRYCDEKRGDNDLKKFTNDIRFLASKDRRFDDTLKLILKKDINKWDISLLAKILDKFCLISEEIKNHVGTFRWLRNSFLCHASQTTLRERTFENRFKHEFEEALKGFLDYINDDEFSKKTNEDVESTISGRYSLEQAFETLKAWWKSDNSKKKEREVSSDPETMKLMYDVLKTNPKVKALGYGSNSGVRLCDDMEIMCYQPPYTTWNELGCTVMECTNDHPDNSMYGCAGAVLFYSTTCCYLPVIFVVKDLTTTEAVAEVALEADIKKKSPSKLSKTHQQLALKLTLSVGNGNRLILNVICRGEKGENKTTEITLSDRNVGDHAVCAIGLKINGSSKTITILDHETGKVLATEGIDFGSHPIRPMFSVFRSKVLCVLRTRVCLPKCCKDPNLTENMEIFKQEHLEFDPISLHSACSVTERQLPYFSNNISLQTNVTSARTRDGLEMFQKYTGGLIRNLQLHTKSVVYICFVLRYPEFEANELEKDIKLAEIILCDHDYIQTYTNTRTEDKRGESLSVQIIAKGSCAAPRDTGATKTSLSFNVEYPGKPSKYYEYKPTSNVVMLGVVFVGPKRKIHIINVVSGETIDIVERNRMMKSNLIPVVGVFYKNTFVSVPGTPLVPDIK